MNHLRDEFNKNLSLRTRDLYGNNSKNNDHSLHPGLECHFSSYYFSSSSPSHGKEMIREVYHPEDDVMTFNF